MGFFFALTKGQLLNIEAGLYSKLSCYVNIQLRCYLNTSAEFVQLYINEVCGNMSVKDSPQIL